MIPEEIINKAFLLNRMHKKELLRSNKCRCYCCGKIFNPKEIVEWVCDYDTKKILRPSTAVCPYCDTDAIIYGTKDVWLTKGLLQELNKRSFGKFDL